MVIGSGFKKELLAIEKGLKVLTPVQVIVPVVVDPVVIPKPPKLSQLVPLKCAIINVGKLLMYGLAVVQLFKGSSQFKVISTVAGAAETLSSFQ